MDVYEGLSHTKWHCKYHIIFIPKCRRRTISTVGRDQEQIREYIKKQEAEDTRLEQLNLWR